MRRIDALMRAYSFTVAANMVELLETRQLELQS
jgi:hypothetical protein